MRSAVLVGLIVLGVADLVFLNALAAPRYVEELRSQAGPAALQEPAEVELAANGSQPSPPPPTPPRAPPTPVPPLPGAPDAAPDATPAPAPSQAEPAEASPPATPVEPMPAGLEPAAAEPPPPPAAVAPAATAEAPAVTVLFLERSSTIGPEAARRLDQVASTLAAEPSRRVLLRGHTDRHGFESWNIGLSQRRAESAAAYLVRCGVDRGRIDLEWFGESQPIDPRDIERAHARNRRVEVLWR